MVSPTTSPHHPVTSRPTPFASVRRQLVAWNIGVLCAILLVVAVSMYVSQSRAVVAQVDAQLSSEAQRGLADGHLGSDLSDAAPESIAADEGTDPYESTESPNLFTILLDAHGHVLRAPQNARALSLPDMGAAWPVLKGSAPHTLLTLDAPATRGGGHFRIYTVPVRQNGHIVGALQVATSLAPRYAQLRDFLVLLALAGGAGVVLAAVGGLFLAHRALVPVQTAFERQRIFVADASHELRTPLSLMRAEAELLMRGLESRARAAVAGAPPAAARTAASPASTPAPSAPDSPDESPPEAGEWAEMARDLVTEVDYMSHLIDDLLQLARMDSGAEPLHLETVDAGALIERTCRSAEPSAALRGLRLSVRCGQEPGEIAGNTNPAEAASAEAPEALWVWADPDRLRQIVLILLDNALRYTPASGTIHLACWREGPPGGSGSSIVLEVSDTGPGIAPEHLSRLFDRFYRVDKARSREMGGAGLGLAIADGLARAQGGTLSVESELGVGTTFRLTLPAALEP